MGTQKDFFKIYRQFGHTPSKSFASSDLICCEGDFVSIRGKSDVTKAG